MSWPLRIFCLVAFAAVMWGFMFMAGSGISEAFGIAFIFGCTFAVAVVACVTDSDDCPRIAAIGFLTASVLCGMEWAYRVGRGTGSGWHDYLGILVGFAIMFPLTYWVQGDDREKRGNPRRWTLGMMFQRKPDRSRPYS